MDLGVRRDWGDGAIAFALFRNKKGSPEDKEDNQQERKNIQVYPDLKQTLEVREL